MSVKSLLVANPKGGSGKTTLSTNLAGYLASAGRKVQLMDMDRQKSATQWLALRDPALPSIGLYQPGKNTTQGADWLVIDSAAGLHGKTLDHTLGLARRIVVPIAPSLYDMAASVEFLRGLKEEKPIRKGKIFVGVVGMRIDPRTRAATMLESYLEELGLPVLAYLRYTQSYVNAAFEGKSLFDMPHYLASREIEQWEYLIDWLNQEDQA
jgi:chromosome partitioning protein